jgi:hypothetical protein
MRRAYWAMTQLPAYIQLLALVLGVSPTRGASSESDLTAAGDIRRKGMTDGPARRGDRGNRGLGAPAPAAGKRLALGRADPGGRLAYTDMSWNREMNEIQRAFERSIGFPIALSPSERRRTAGLTLMKTHYVLVRKAETSSPGGATVLKSLTASAGAVSRAAAPRAAMAAR